MYGFLLFERNVILIGENFGKVFWFGFLVVVESKV